MKEKAIEEEQKTKAKIEITYQREMYIQEQKCNGGL